MFSTGFRYHLNLIEFAELCQANSKVKSKRIYDPMFPGSYQEFTNFFYTQKYLYCERNFEAKRVDTAFFSQSCCNWVLFFFI
ncbi:hypothetical protein AWR27_00855 [Spirosoma montaniterrae]|uniref:Uncharacterized protein n=1 Tax=Spirosoma montaniterrae TaxID=1178516 RepID=A0A1P9WRN5_9BACT|nr:hypothetical protein AWR27_00855 [Spirosoma montaniterrae]